MKISLPQTASARIVGLALAAIGICLSLAGCIIIPTDYHTAWSRHNITLETTNAFQIGLTTREEILLGLGEPDFASEDGQRFGYMWSKVKVLLIIASTGPGSVAEFARSYLIEFSFDPRNRVSGVRLLKHWGESVPTQKTEGSP